MEAKPPEARRVARFRQRGGRESSVSFRFLALTFPAALLAAAGLLSAPRVSHAISFWLPDEAFLELMFQWTDSVTVAGRRFAVPEQWRGLRVGSPDQPPPADLEAVPAELRSSDREVRLRAETLRAFRRMAAAAEMDGHRLRIQSGYRSPEEQARLIEKRLAAGRDFEEIAWGVAPPGYSEHMLGTVVDLSLGGNYAANPSYLWLRDHAAEYGFFESYPHDEDPTFPWEPWHWRYKGIREKDADRRHRGEAEQEPAPADGKDEHE